MKLAVYSGKESNHFALGLEEYCHFTSPIRRYSDLVTHRVIKRLLKKRSSYSQDEIDGIATICSDKDREAEKIVRESSKYLSCKCAEKHIGKEFYGEVVAVLEFGVFMHIDGLNIEGFCHIKILKDHLIMFMMRQLILLLQQIKIIFMRWVINLKLK